MSLAYIVPLRLLADAPVSILRCCDVATNGDDRMSDFSLPPISGPDEGQTWLAAVVSSSDDAIISKDLNGIVQSWNAGATRVFGYTAQEMVGKPITTLFPRDRLDEEPKILERIRRGEPVD